MEASSGTNSRPRPLPLLFVDPEDKNIRHKARCHTQLTSARKKRDAKASKARAERNKGILASGPLVWQAAKRSESQTSSLERPFAVLAGKQKMRETVDEDIQEQEENIINSTSPPSSPRTLLSAAKIDPFRIYPVGFSNRHVDALVSHIAFDIGPLTQGHPSGSRFDFCRDCRLTISLTNPPAFHSILAIAATHIDALFGKKPGQRAIWHRVEAIRMVNQQLGGGIIDILRALMTIANLMTLEMLWGDQAVGETHAKGLATILHRTEGLREVQGYLRMEFCLYQAIAFPMGLIPFHTTYASISQTNRRLTEQEACRDLRNEFIKFFTIIRQKNLNLSSLHPSTSTFFTWTPLVKVLFPDTLGSQEDSDYGIHRLQNNYRLGILLQFFCIYFEGGPRDLIGERAVALQRKILRYKPAWDGSAEALHAVTAKHAEELRLDYPDCAWKASRMLAVVAMLSGSSAEVMRTMLSGVLTGQMSISLWDVSWGQVLIELMSLSDVPSLTPVHEHI